ncbi:MULTISPECIES: cysteine hydrolase family protein [unclassified Paenibacillus]|uniref:Cysteine hydrolase family protein n=1 Tax=Paenibacillus provencensis TaxID=441151 RepID=A0ABW3PM35_9BACL|nr:MULTISPECIES: cysteine hydrolase family protein [unclassified Paenibacillus]MCM3129722.1 cysteine hydrolase [Paenibacillus sp. MER 78]SFS54993.1 Nicotinamidase-related amidase [Paenibacillus sp. 453mf]
MIHKPALLIVDVQTGSFMDPLFIHNSEKLLTNIKQLITWAHISKIPVILTQHNGKLGTITSKTSSGWCLHPALPLLAQDTKIEKDFPDSFQGTNLESHLTHLNVNRLVVAGIQTEICVDSTCRRAFSLGYDVILVKDAHSTADSSFLSADQIISHHNMVLQNWFVSLSDTQNIIMSVSR